MTSPPVLAPCGASWHGMRPGAPDCGCGWGQLCTLPPQRTEEWPGYEEGAVREHVPYSDRG